MILKFLQTTTSIDNEVLASAFENAERCVTLIFDAYFYFVVTRLHSNMLDKDFWPPYLQYTFKIINVERVIVVDKSSMY